MLKIISSFMARASGAFAALMLAIVVARLLPVEKAGLFHFSYALVLVASGLSRWGLDNASTRNSSLLNENASPSSALSVLQGVAILNAITSVCLTVVVCSALFIFSSASGLIGASTASIAFATLAIVPVAATGYIGYFLLGAGKNFTGVFTAQGAFPTFLVIILVGFEGLGIEPGNFIAPIILSAALMAFLVAARAFGLYWKLLARPRAKKIKLALFYGKPAIISALSFLLISWAPTLVISLAGSVQEAAVFASASRISLVGTLILAAMNAAIAAPSAKYIARGQRQEVMALTRGMSAIVCVIAFPLILACYLFAVPVMAVLYGDAYSSGGALLRVLLLAQVFNVVTGPVALVLSMAGEEVGVRNGYVLGLVVFLTICVALVLMGLGGLGAAIATLAAQIVQNGYWMWRVNKTIGGPIWPRYKDMFQASRLLKVTQ